SAPRTTPTISARISSRFRRTIRPIFDEPVRVKYACFRSEAPRAMRLESKGEIRPPPTLKGPAQSVSREIQSWPRIIAATHWFLYDRTQVDGADFYVGEKE